MKLWIICSAEGAMPAGKLNSADYRALRRKAMSEAVIPEGEKSLHGKDLMVYISPSPAARLTAEALCPGAALTVREELDVPEAQEGLLPAALFPLPLRARLDAARGEAKQKALAKAAALCAELDKAGLDCVLFSHPEQIPLLMDALQRRGYCFNRTYLGAIRPLERILATRRSAHCGGCGHNCMLSNPGCDIGRDKAARAGIPYRK